MEVIARHRHPANHVDAPNTVTTRTQSRTPDQARGGSNTAAAPSEDHPRDPDQIDMFPALTPVEPEPLTPGAKRTQRNSQLAAAFLHPLTVILRGALKLHADAAPHDDRDAPGLRCGTCRFRRPVHGGARNYPKCTRTRLLMTHSDASDCRAFWPACTFHEQEANA
ncbi:hypothetical protein [Amycolatopsis sp. DSM 110486]|uniref:hypothetical protein n=1 Tax=Amycolatopsis sp. DSM 110486 TaxID=2865832 RepID=UPI001C6A2353|nr:hypothetical protein [Amycolatopsis sp. DSM 110486]QYN17448.1 hypothetical protein K1T34_32190 [Amycolatopsis sp. DSM 110486]